MHQHKSRSFARHQLMLAALLLLACFLLLAAATWARYRADEVSYLNYAVKMPESISLQTDSGWMFSEQSGVLAFTINNNGDGVGDAPRVSVRLLASVSIAELAGETVQLSIFDGEGSTVYTAQPVSIREGTALYKTFGAGKVYLFRDGEGNEMSWEVGLFGLPAQLEIIGLEKPENPALLQLQVVGK